MKYLIILATAALLSFWTGLFYYEHIYSSKPAIANESVKDSSFRDSSIATESNILPVPSEGLILSVSKAEGIFEVMTKQKGYFERANSGILLQAGDTIRTLENSKVTLSNEDLGNIVLEEDSSIGLINTLETTFLGSISGLVEAETTTTVSFRSQGLLISSNGTVTINADDQKGEVKIATGKGTAVIALSDYENTNTYTLSENQEGIVTNGQFERIE